MRTIVIIRFSSMGDIVLTNQVYRTLKNSLKSSVRLAGVVLKGYERLLPANPYLDETIVHDPKKEGWAALAARIRKLRPETVIDLHDNMRSGWLRTRLGASRILVYRKLSLERRLLVMFKINLLKGAKRVIERYLETCAPLMPSGAGAPDNFFSVPPETLAGTSKKWLGKIKSGFIAVCKEARWNTKQWPSYNELLDILVREKGRQVVLIGERTDKSVTGLEASHRGKFTNLTGKLGILESAAVIKKSGLFITNDTGLMHIADAMRKKTISIWGPTVFEFGFKPLNPGTPIVANEELKCRPCSLHGGAACPLGHFRCMRTITPQKIAELAMES